MFEIIVRAIISDKAGKILLLKRAKQPEQFKWSLPGGKVEVLEKAPQAIVREIMEELQLTLEPEFLFINENIFPQKQLHSLMVYYGGVWKGKIILKKDENTEYKFFSREELQQTTEIAWDHRQVLLDYLDEAAA